MPKRSTRKNRNSNQNIYFKAIDTLKPEGFTGEKLKVTLSMDRELKEAVSHYQEVMGLPSFASALNQIVRLYLDTLKESQKANDSLLAQLSEVNKRLLELESKVSDLGNQKPISSKSESEES